MGLFYKNALGNSLRLVKYLDSLLVDLTVWDELRDTD